jgi:hypothetical protein
MSVVLRYFENVSTENPTLPTVGVDFQHSAV